MARLGSEKRKREMYILRPQVGLKRNDTRGKIELVLIDRNT